MIKKLPTIILGVLLLFLLYWRWRVGLTRFFDVDEFSYLHWAANFARGERPYTDFFLFITPGFLWFFAPLIKLFSFQASVFLAARVVSFILFLGILGLLTILFGTTRGWKWALIPAILLSFLPMPYDKFFEVRPDNLATILAFGGMVLEVLALRQKKKTMSLWFWSGFCYMASILVLVKTLPFLLVGAIFAWLHGNRKAFFFGLFVPFGIFLLSLLTLGDLGKAWYSLVKLPFEANMVASYYIMEPHLYFFPTSSFYGAEGITLGLLLNHAIWFIGIIMGVYRFLTPFLTADGDRKKVLAESLVGGIFLLSVFGYVEFFPLKHSQYLIPIALFIAYYSADMIAIVLSKVEKILPVFVLLVIGGYYISVATVQVNQIKLLWTNKTQLSQVDSLMKIVDPATEVLDLEGRMLFWKDAYYICCVPFGSFVPFLSQQPPLLRDVLEAKKIPYIFQGFSNRLPLLSNEDQVYIRAHYVPVDGWGEDLWRRN